MTLREPRGAAPPGAARELLRDALGWDSRTWTRALQYCVGASRLWPGRALEIGADAENGGLSLYLAAHGWEVTCSGLGPPSPRMRDVHDAHGVSPRIRYALHDALDPVPDGPYDLIVVRSVLGQVGVHGRADLQRRAVLHLHDALRPGGELWLMENAVGGPLHARAHRSLGAGRYGWRYLARHEAPLLLSRFAELRYATFGVTAALGRTEAQRRALASADSVLEHLVPPTWRYVLAAVATRAERQAS